MSQIIFLKRSVYGTANIIIFNHSYNRPLYELLKKCPMTYWCSYHKSWVANFNDFSLEKFTKYIDGACSVNSHSLYAKTKEVKRSVPSLPLLSSLKKEYIISFKNYMRQLRYSENTISSYSDCLSNFFRFHNTISINSITTKHIELFNNEYIIKYKYSVSYQNQTINAIKLFFSSQTSCELNVGKIERPKKEHKLPVIYSLNEVERLLNAVTNIKHKSMLVLIYSSGLRSGELINLKIADIDSNRMVIHIHGGKGKKDRIVPLAESALHLIRLYYKKHHPKEFLFNGANSLQYSYTSLQNLYRKAKNKAGIIKKGTLHTLRHSYATHLMEDGVHLRYIQELLGHNSPKTTQIYTHVSSEESRIILSPLEKINIHY